MAKAGLGRADLDGQKGLLVIELHLNLGMPFSYALCGSFGWSYVLERDRFVKNNQFKVFIFEATLPQL